MQSVAKCGNGKNGIKLHRNQFVLESLFWLYGMWVGSLAIGKDETKI